MFYMNIFVKKTSVSYRVVQAMSLITVGDRVGVICDLYIRIDSLHINRVVSVLQIRVRLQSVHVSVRLQHVTKHVLNM